MTGFAPEGRIKARLFLELGVIARADIEPRPPAPVKALLEGRDVREAVALLPRLFSICRQAQTVAALNAAEAALGLAPNPAQSAARQIFLLAETAQEHATRLLIDAPLLFGLSPDVQAAKALRNHVAGLAELVSPGNGWVNPGAARLTPNRQGLAEWLEGLRRLVLQHVMGGYDIAGAATIADWLGQTGSLPARILAGVTAAGCNVMGASPTQLMGPLDADYIQSGIVSDAFVCRPVTAKGLCLETGPLARQAEHRLIKALHGGFGLGLAARLTARLLEVSHAVTGIALSLPMLESAQQSDPPPASGEGLGVAEAARGRLFHWLRLENGRVADYRLLAPTEWNFHPEGAYALGLKGLAAASEEEAVRLARLQGLALDPCVALEVEVCHA